jgi:predicted ATP-grasp superfamily ATP-dependent carboligase
VEAADRFGGGLLIPTSDATLSTVSKHKGLLEHHYQVAGSEWEITQQFIDKRNTYALAEAVGVPAPKTVLAKTLTDVERHGRTLRYPCLVKPSHSHRYYALFRRKMVKVESYDQLLSTYKQATDAGFEVMLQELVPGEDSLGANYNSYFWDGRPLVEFTAQKIRGAPPELGSPRVAMSKHIPEVIESGRKILQAIGFYGYSCTEFKKDPRDGVYKLIEVNGRHNLSSLLAVRCGINFPYLHYRHLVHGELPSSHDYQKGIYWIDLTRDVAYGLKHLNRERYTLTQHVRPYLKPHVFAILDWKDPKPFARRILTIFRRMLKKLSRPTNTAPR